MRQQTIYLDNYDWLIKVFYLISNPNIDLILNELDDIDCEPDTFYNAAKLLEDDYLNTGFTYTSNEYHVTIIVIGRAESSGEFFSTFIHEIGHATQHISDYYGIKHFSEEVQYLQGEIGLWMFQTAKEFLCEHCRINFYNYGKMKIKFKES